LTFPQHFTFDFDMDRAPLVFCFILSGKARSVINHGYGHKTVIGGQDGKHYVSYFPKSKGVSEFSAGRPVRMLHVQMDPSMLNTLLHGDFDHVPTDFRTVAEASAKHHYFRSGTMTPGMQIAIFQMLNCAYQGLTQRLFLESKALELVALQLEQSVLSSRMAQPGRHLRPADIERLHEAKDIVGRNMKEPLSLVELARQVGLNEFKLKRGFRQVFGNSVFAYLRELRMQQARLLLEEGKMNVKEVSYAVGFADSGRFSDAFKKQYGIRPSLVRAVPDTSLFGTCRRVDGKRAITKD
jgi:AraC family transcriptional activator of pyochelin receptor